MLAAQHFCSAGKFGASEGIVLQFHVAVVPLHLHTQHLDSMQNTPDKRYASQSAVAPAAFLYEIYSIGRDTHMLDP